MELLSAGMFWDELKLIVKNYSKLIVVFKRGDNYRLKKLKNEELIGVRINFCGRRAQIF